jgi:Raf kinase inhibitor-like YbhB/YbcL family protein
MQMKTRVVLPVLFLGLVVILVGAAARSKAAQSQQALPAADWESHFHLSSKIFEDGEAIPNSMIANTTVGSVCDGQNRSPELSWTDAPEGTKSFVVTLYDRTAGVTHWAAYNIPPTIYKLDENAGRHTTAEVPFGDQTVNSVFFTFGYLGPCPPSGLVHHYEFTVYALDKDHLDLPSPPGFPPDPEALYRAMFDHVLDKASISGHLSCPADSTPTATDPNPTGTCP